MKQNTNSVSPRSNEGRNTFVTKHITEALLSLLKEKSLSDISISELVERAGVGRVSFYRNYECKEDIIKAYLNTIFKEWTEHLAEHPSAPLSEQVRSMIAHFEKHREFYSLLNERGLIYLLKDIFIGLCGPKPEHKAVQAYSSAFVAYTLYGWVDVWFARGMKETSEEIAVLFKMQGL